MSYGKLKHPTEFIYVYSSLQSSANRIILHKESVQWVGHQHTIENNRGPRAFPWGTSVQEYNSKTLRLSTLKEIFCQLN